MTYSAVKHVGSQHWMVGRIVEHVASPLTPEEIDHAVILLNNLDDKSSWRQYFRVDITRGIDVPYLFNLTIWRLMKEKEARAYGFGREDKWVLVGVLKGVDARNAQCIVSMLETPRPPLQNKEEETMWAERVAKLEAPAIDLPNTKPK